MKNFTRLIVLVVISLLLTTTASALPFHHRETLTHKLEDNVVGTHPKTLKQYAREGATPQRNRRGRDGSSDHHNAIDTDHGEHVSSVPQGEDGHYRSDAFKTEHRSKFKCDLYHIEYVARHFDGKPQSLRGEYGCDLWADDAYYHSHTLHAPRIGI